MAMTKRELIQFMDELVELASEENKTRAILVKEKFISDFEKSYEYEKEVQTEVSYLPPYYIAAMPDDVQEEIKQKVIAALTEHGECTPENIENAMCSKIYDLEDLIDIREYVERMEEEQRKKLKSDAMQRGMKESEYIRLLMSQKPNDYPEIRILLRDLINEVNAIGNNINQITRNHNSKLYRKEDRELLSAYMKKLNLLVKEVVDTLGNQ